MAINSHILQVSELTKKVRFILESELNSVWLCGEISNFIAASSGHWYLSLKDAKSQVRCAMFKGSNRKVRLSPSNGQQVLVRAKVSLYEPRGDFQLIIEQMEPAGEGLLRQQYEQLKNRLNAAGYFSLAHKKELPEKISKVGIVTSPTGAAVKDIISVLQRRNPLIELFIYPALVQGQQAADDICRAIEIANQRAECDVLLVGRGGGSLEDLWPFNEEVVVQAIFNSKLPVVSAVGHEIDTTLADYVADVRAATPSAAAELVSEDQLEVRYKITQLQQKMIKLSDYHLQRYQEKLKAIQHRLTLLHPAQKLQVQQQKVDELHQRLQQCMRQYLIAKANKPQLLTQKLQALSPSYKLEKYQVTLTNLNKRLTSEIASSLHEKQQKFAHLIEQLSIVSPLATIARGYSITRDKNKNIIKNVEQVAVGDELSVQLSKGTINAKVTETN